MIFWPVVQQRLVELLPTLAGFEDWKIHDRAIETDADARKFVIVGGLEPEQGGDPRTGGGSFEFVDSAVSNMRAEQGTVVCEFVRWGGDEALPDYQVDLFAFVDALDWAIREDQSLGIGLTTTDLSADITSAQDGSGATQRLTVSVNYLARSYART